MSSNTEHEDAPRSKRKNYDIHFKLEAVAYAEKYNKSKAAKDMNVPRACIQNWVGQKALLEAQLWVATSSTKSSTKRLLGAGRRVKDKDLDEKLIVWIQRQLKKDIRITRAMIREEALSLSTEDNFKASDGWLEKFLIRHHLASRPLPTTCKEEQEEEEEYVDVAEGDVSDADSDVSLDFH